MTHRILHFLPSILILFGIYLATYAYLIVIANKFSDRLRSIEWCQRNRWKVAFLIVIPTRCLLAPTIEELMFRAPLIIAFGALSPAAWCGIVASSALFAASHWPGKKFLFSEVLSARKRWKVQPDDLSEAFKKFERNKSKKKGKETRKRKMIHVAFTFFIGSGFGYCGVRYQSLWVVAGLHSVWNLILGELLAMVVVLTVMGFLKLGKMLFRRAQTTFGFAG